MTESSRIEYKRELTDSLEREVVAFLNYYDGGIIYLGIDKDAQVVGLTAVDAIQLAVKDRLKKSFLRVVMPYAKPFDYAAPVETQVETPVEPTRFILKSLKENPRLTLAEVAGTIGKSVSAVERASTKLVKAGKLKHVGPKKGGQWEVLEGADE
jgi:predicted HTH transcriptional regulator